MDHIRLNINFDHIGEGERYKPLQFWDVPAGIEILSFSLNDVQISYLESNAAT
jgi:hypothetical protein